MSKVSVIAQMNIDLVFSGFDALPKMGEEVLADGLDVQLGGGPMVVPILLRRMGIDASLGLFLSDDTLSRWARQLLDEAGYDSYKNLYRGSGHPVVLTSVFSFGGDRSFLCHNQRVYDDSLPDEDVYGFLKGSDFCFAPHSEAVLRQLKTDGARVFFDTGWHDDLSIDKYRHILQYTDYFMPNEKEAVKMTGASSPERAAELLCDVVPCAIVKLGDRGCVAARDGELIRIDAIRGLPSVDSTGAGDNFMAGLLYGLASGWDLRRSLQMGNVFGGYSTTAYGCYKAGLTRETALELFETHYA